MSPPIIHRTLSKSGGKQTALSFSLSLFLALTLPRHPRSSRQSPRPARTPQSRSWRRRSAMTRTRSCAQRQPTEVVRQQANGNIGHGDSQKQRKERTKHGGTDGDRSVQDQRAVQHSTAQHSTQGHDTCTSARCLANIQHIHNTHGTNARTNTDQSVWETPSADLIVAGDSDIASGLVWLNRTRRSFGVDVTCDPHTTR